MSTSTTDETRFRELSDLAESVSLECAVGNSRLGVFPALGGRGFAEVRGVCAHRVDLDAVRNPGESFNNYGGNNFWPAPEGGELGFNYRGGEWYVQEAVNSEPFRVLRSQNEACCIEKDARLANRKGTRVDTVMRREFSLSPIPEMLRAYRLEGHLCYTVRDSIRVSDEVSASDALIASWTLEQFAASRHTVSFCVVDRPEAAINFDFYDHPGERITYLPSGFLYRTDGRSRGQIGVKLSSAPAFIGFYDLSRRMLCIRRNMNAGDGLYFNIADNDQPRGCLSAADVYSIFNSDEDMSAFELETVGSARLDGTCLLGSELVSESCLAMFEEQAELEGFLTHYLGGFK
jgi:hypothetical protein